MQRWTDLTDLFSEVTMVVSWDCRNAFILHISVIICIAWTVLCF